jgi:hypothetical protein
MINLYRRMLKQGKAELKYTSYEWYKKRLRQEFEKNRNRQDNKICLERGEWILKNKMGGLL